LECGGSVEDSGQQPERRFLKLFEVRQHRIATSFFLAVAADDFCVIQLGRKNAHLFSERSEGSAFAHL
jgi:hypothetical protein